MQENTELNTTELRILNVLKTNQAVEGFIDQIDLHFLNKAENGLITSKSTGEKYSSPDIQNLLRDFLLDPTLSKLAKIPSRNTIKFSWPENNLGLDDKEHSVRDFAIAIKDRLLDIENGEISSEDKLIDIKDARVLGRTDLSIAIQKIIKNKSLDCRDYVIGDKPKPYYYYYAKVSFYDQTILVNLDNASHSAEKLIRTILPKKFADKDKNDGVKVEIFDQESDVKEVEHETPNLSAKSSGVRIPIIQKLREKLGRK